MKLKKTRVEKRNELFATQMLFVKCLCRYIKCSNGTHTIYLPSEHLCVVLLLPFADTTNENDLEKRGQPIN